MNRWEKEVNDSLNSAPRKRIEGERFCPHEDCGKKLSVYNLSGWCYAHRYVGEIRDRDQEKRKRDWAYRVEED